MLASPTMYLPGSSISFGDIPRLFERSLNVGRIAPARSRGSGVSISFWYGMPSPPPRSTNLRSTPSLVICSTRSIIFSTASPKGATSMICEPMWQWMPTGRTPLSFFASLYAFTTSAYPIPNLEAARPVAIFGWVSGDTSGLTLNATSIVLPDLTARSERAYSSCNESIETRTPESIAICSSFNVFELPLNRIRSGGIPARSAAYNSPSEKTSAPAPSDARIRRIARFQFAFAA